MQTTTFEDVLNFWFPSLPDGDRTARVRQFDWWFRGGGNTEIVARFSPLLECAIAGELDDWAQEPRSRLALILILDQFSRTIYRGTAQAFAQDETGSVGWVEQGETQHTQQSFFHPLDDVFVGLVARNENRHIGAFSGVLQVSEDKICKTLFGTIPFAYVLFAELSGREVGFALYGFRYSSLPKK